MRHALAATVCAALLACGEIVPGEDTDGDGVADLADNCPAVENTGQENSDRRPLGLADEIPFGFRPTPVEVAVTGDDAMSEPIQLPFPFTFYGTTYSEVVVSSDGFLLLGPNPIPEIVYSNAAAIPSFYAPNALIAGYWDDLDQSAGGQIVWALQGSAPERELVVEYTAVPHFGATPEMPFAVTMQIVLREAGSQVEVHCQACQSDGTEHTQGVEDQSGRFGMALPGRSHQSFSIASDAVRFESTLAAADGAGDACDTCPSIWSADIADRDGDGIGDACDDCPRVPDPDQSDLDGDQIGDLCDGCPTDFDEQGLDSDGDGIGDICDPA